MERGQERRFSGPRRAARLLVFGLVFLSVGAAFAQGEPVRVEDLPAGERERARGLMDLGDQKMAAGDALGALAAYSAADEIVGVPTTGIEVGRAQQALGLWIEARDTWVRVARYPKRQDEPEPFTEARREAEQLALALAERIPTLLIQIEPVQGLTVVLDEDRLGTHLLGVPLRVNPGVHRLDAGAPGHDSISLSVAVAEKATRTVQLALVRSAPAPASGGQHDRRRSSRGSPGAMWTGFGVAVAGAALGAGLGISAFEQTAWLREQCDGSICPEELAEEIDFANTTSALSTVSFAVGAAGLGVGIWQAVVLAGARGDTGSTRGRRGLAHSWSLLPAGPGARLAYTLRFP